MTGLKIAGVPLIVVIAIVILCARLALLLYRTAVGRELFATGSNPDGARLIGIPVDRRILMAFGMAGLLGGLCGALWASRYATIDARVALGFELTVIASAVVGGVAIRGGSGTLLGIVFGALTLLVIRNGLTLVRVDPLWLQGVSGLVAILVAIGVDTLIRARRAGRRVWRPATIEKVLPFDRLLGPAAGGLLPGHLPLRGDLRAEFRLRIRYCRATGREPVERRRC